MKKKHIVSRQKKNNNNKQVEWLSLAKTHFNLCSETKASVVVTKRQRENVFDFVQVHTQSEVNRDSAVGNRVNSSRRGLLDAFTVELYRRQVADGRARENRIFKEKTIKTLGKEAHHFVVA